MKSFIGTVSVLVCVATFSKLSLTLGLDSKIVTLMGIVGAFLGVWFTEFLCGRYMEESKISEGRPSHNIIYVQVYRNRVRMLNLRTGLISDTHSTYPFSTSRMLVGQFDVYEETLKKAIKEVGGAIVWRPSPKLLVHALDGFDNDLSQVEERALVEGCYGARASEVRIYHGAILQGVDVPAAYQMAGQKVSNTSAFHLN